MSLRETERESIALFLRHCAADGEFDGKRVYDFGCGTQPYRKIIEEAGGEYHGFDRESHPGTVVLNDVGPEPWAVDPGEFDVVLMTQVWQYVPLRELQRRLHEWATGRELVKSHATLIATGPTNWPVVEREDLHRMTIRGVLDMLRHAGWTQRDVQVRATVRFEGETWPIGWQAVARS